MSTHHPAVMPANSPQHKPIIAVVGLSNRTDRPSYEVSAYMQQHGYRIIPVNPLLADTTILGEHCYASLQQAAQALANQGLSIAIVDCFRKSADIPPLAQEAIEIEAKCLWMQQGIINEAAAVQAQAAGLIVIMDRCIKIEHALGQLHGVL